MRSYGMVPRIVALLLALGSATAQAEPSWTEHTYLPTLIPMSAVSDREMTDATDTNAFFSRVNGHGYLCTAADYPASRRMRIRRVTITCLQDSDKIVYEGGFSAGYGTFTVDRITVNETLLGGRRVGEHVRGMLVEPEPQRTAVIKGGVP
jgi:hypothetical protein